MWTLAALAGWRAAAYRLLAALLLPPSPQRWQRLSAVAGDLRHAEDAVAAFPFFQPWRHLLQAIEEIDAAGLARLPEAYVRLFQISRDGVSLPYESCYGVPDGQGAGWVAALLTRTYARAGLNVAPSAGESPDHVAVELEFMAHLCAREAAAWAEPAPREALGLLAQERSFLRLHLGRWLGDFAAEVRARAAEPLYVATATAAEALVHHDSDLVEALLDQIAPLCEPGEPPAARTHEQTVEDSTPREG
ncbi:MAG: molecular chaperone TorD family protein [Chloroflexi bacterium]|nr:molecular chaperone TorD family protein [Chloroflexota bacterium]